MPRILVCYGTRPEKIKLGPVIEALEHLGAEVSVFETVQSPDLLGEPRGKGGVVWTNLSIGISSVLQNLRLLTQSVKPDAVLVQGDTATAFACTLGAFLEGIPVGHVEAGLRTYADEPYPEEAFRRAITAFASWHFCPDIDALVNITAESGRAYSAKPRAWVTGNPLIDTLPKRKPLILATLHRRENWGDRIKGALLALQTAAGHPIEPEIMVVRHPNWPAQGIDEDEFPKLRFVDPMSHAHFLTALEAADVVVTDSGGLQEEAAHFGTDCIVVRSSTERVGLQRVRAITLVDPDEPTDLVSILTKTFEKRRAYGYGDAGHKIATLLMAQLDKGGEDAETEG